MANDPGPLFSLFKAFIGTRTVTEGLFHSFIESQLTAANVSVTGSDVTLLYSGKYDGALAYKMANSMNYGDTPLN
jgi:hypothetical protein